MKFDESSYAILPWSVVSFCLQVAVDAKQVRQFAIFSAEVITEVTTRYAQYEILFRTLHGNDELDRRLTNVYKAVLLYVIALDDWFTTGSFPKVWVLSYDSSNHF